MLIKAKKIFKMSCVFGSQICLSEFLLCFITTGFTIVNKIKKGKKRLERLDHQFLNTVIQFVSLIFKS